MILLVEDHPQLRLILSESLRDRGFEVVTANSGDDALAMLERGLAPKLVFTDIRMPGALNGLQLAQWIRKNRPTVRVLLQTGFTHESTDSFAVLRKPYTDDDLFEALQRLVGNDAIGRTGAS